MGAGLREAGGVWLGLEDRGRPLSWDASGVNLNSVADANLVAGARPSSLEGGDLPVLLSLYKPSIANRQSVSNNVNKLIIAQKQT